MDNPLICNESSNAEADKLTFDFVTLLHPLDAVCGKPISWINGVARLDDDVEAERAKAEGRKPRKRAHPTFYSAREVSYSTLDELVSILSAAKREFLVNERVVEGVNHFRLRRLSKNFATTKHRFIPIDIDDTQTTESDGATVARIMRDRLPQPFHNARCIWGLTASHIIGKSGAAKVRLYFLSDRPVDNRELEAWLAPHADIADPAIYHDRQANYLAPGPIKGGPDPFEGKRWGVLDGERDLVTVPPEIESRKRSDRKQWTAPANVKVDDPDMLRLAIPRLLRQRTAGRIERDKRRNTIRFVACDLKDRAVSHATATAILLCWYWHDDENAAELRQALADCGLTDAAGIAEAVRSHGAGLEDVWAQNDDIGDAEIAKQIDDAYASKDRPFGCVTLEMERASAELADGAEFGAADDSDETGDRAAPAREAFAAWRETGDATALIATLAGSDGTKRRALELACARVDGAEFFGEADSHSDLEFVEGLIAKATPEKVKAPFLPAPLHIADPDKLAPRQFVYSADYIRKYVSLTTSPGGRGKSSLLLAEAVGMAAGRDLSRKPTKTLRVLHWNLEDPLDELRLRVGALLKYHGLKSEDLGNRLYVLSGRDHPLKIAYPKDGRPKIDRAEVEKLVAMLQALRIDVLQIDPFVSLHLCGENDTAAMDLVIKELGRVADACNCAVHVANHSRKPLRDGDGKITSMDSRGASALIDGVRAQRLLNPMTDKEATLFGIEPESAWRYIKLEDGKGNLRPKSAGQWLKLESQGLDNATDDAEASNVQVVVAWSPPNAGGRGTDAQERLAAWLTGATKEDERRPVKEAAAATGLDSKDFRRNVLGDKDRVRTSLGLIEHESHRGKTGNLIRLTQRPDVSYAAPGEEDGDRDDD